VITEAQLVIAVHRFNGDRPKRANDERGSVDLLWIILIVILVLALLGFFSRGRW
jgi:flagellar basal body-associated protein FliL